MLELNWKCPGRVAVQELTTPQKQVEIVQETPEEDLRVRDKQMMLSMFDADDMSNQEHTPASLSKTPLRGPKNTPKAKASFDKIFNRVSLKSTPSGEAKPCDDA